MNNDEERRKIREFKEKFDDPKFLEINWKDERAFKMEAWDASYNFDQTVEFEDVTDEESSDLEDK